MCGSPRWSGAAAFAVALAACSADPPPDPPSRAAPLPPTAPTTATATASTTCADPIAGEWRARRLTELGWGEHRVVIERRGGVLACGQEWRSWNGQAEDVTPPPCARGGRSYYVTQLRCEASGSTDELEVRSLRILSERHTCDGELTGYNLDHFTGAVHGNRWDAINDDGGGDVSTPYTFRRVTCAP